MTDTAALEALKAQLAAITAQVAALEAAPPPVVAPEEPAPPRPVRLHALIGGPELGYLHRDPREVRRLAEAVALAKGALGPAHEIPADWLPALRRLAAARAAGRSWCNALEEAGLEIPRDLEVQAQAVRLELDSLWDRVLPLTGLVLGSVNSSAKISLQTALKRILT